MYHPAGTRVSGSPRYLRQDESFHFAQELFIFPQSARSLAAVGAAFMRLLCAGQVKAVRDIGRQLLCQCADLNSANVSQAACERAGLREGGDQANLVTEDDVLRAASEVLRKTATKLDRELNRRAGHVQVRNAS
jgi:hypothetical protein